MRIKHLQLFAIALLGSLTASAQNKTGILLPAAQIPSNSGLPISKSPTCTQPVGKWQNERQSVLEIKTYDAATGAISGQYTSRSGASAGSTPYPVVGWINSAPLELSDSRKGGKVNHAEVFTFAVRWGALGSVSSWTGTCAVNSHSGLGQFTALWHTTRPNSGFDWDHTLTGADRFDPIE